MACWGIGRGLCPRVGDYFRGIMSGRIMSRGDYVRIPALRTASRQRSELAAQRTRTHIPNRDILESRIIFREHRDTRLQTGTVLGLSRSNPDEPQLSWTRRGRNYKPPLSTGLSHCWKNVVVLINTPNSNLKT